MRSAIVVVVLAGSLASACGTSRTPQPESSRQTAIAVSVDVVTSADLRSRIEAGGIVRAGTTATITSRVMAPIQAVHVRDGDHVKRGQTLISLDARELTAQAERAAASLASAADAARGAEARIAAADAAHRLAGATHARISGLFDKRSATPQELDHAAAELGGAEAQLAAARADSAAAAAARDAARAAADAASVSRSFATITAPFDGVVASRLADPGSLASPGIPLLVIEEAGPARLDILLDESRGARTKAGDRAEVQLDGASDVPWLAATVLEVGRVDPSSHSLLIKLQLPADAAARTGSFGRARLEGGSRRTTVVPTSSVVWRAGLSFVFGVDSGNRARLRPVVTGAVDGDRTEILAGVPESSTVILSPPPGLTDGSPVSLEPRR